MAYELIKVSELPELTTPSDPNVLPVQDGDYLKRISFENLKEAVTGDVADDLAAEVTARGNADTAILADLASPYSASSTYAVGDYCTKDGQLYRCTTAISTAEAWTAAHWTAVTMGEDVSDLRSAFDDLTVIQNLFDKSKTVQGGYFGGSGGISANENSYYNTEYIPIIAGTPYTFTASSGDPYYIATYSADKTFIQRVNPTGNSVVFSSGVYFVRISIYNKAFDNTFKFAKTTDFYTIGNEHLYLNGGKIVNAPYQNVITADETVTNVTKDVMTFDGNYYPGSAGDKTELSSQYWYQIVATNTFHIWCDPDITYPDCMVALYNNGLATRSNFIARYRKNDSSDTLPTYENKLEVLPGQLLVISVYNDAAFEFVSDEMNTGKQIFENGIYLSPDMIAQVADKIKIKPTTNLYKIINGDIVINFSHIINAGSRSNLWNFKGITKNGATIVSAGTDIVGVLREVGESDFMGGVHGDETVVDFQIFADGQLVTEETLCDEIDIFMQSHLTRVSTGDNVVDRFVHITIKRNVIEIETTFKALTNINIMSAYCGGMFAWYEDQKIYAASNLGELVGSGSSGVTVQNSHDLYTATVITSDYMAKCENLVGMNNPDSYGDAYYYGNESHPRMKLYLAALANFTFNSNDILTGKSRYTIT